MQVNINRAKKTFGFSEEDSIGKIFFPAVQAAPCFCSVFPHMFGKDARLGCLIPCAIDQVCFAFCALLGVLCTVGTTALCELYSNDAAAPPAQAAWEV